LEAQGGWSEGAVRLQGGSWGLCGKVVSQENQPRLSIQAELVVRNTSRRRPTPGSRCPRNTGARSKEGRRRKGWGTKREAPHPARSNTPDRSVREGEGDGAVGVGGSGCRGHWSRANPHDVWGGEGCFPVHDCSGPEGFPKREGCGRWRAHPWEVRGVFPVFTFGWAWSPEDHLLEPLRGGKPERSLAAGFGVVASWVLPTRVSQLPPAPSPPWWRGRWSSP
jgi:hypothetical protein